MKVCRAFQIRSKAGILSAKNSIPNSTVLATMMGQLSSSCSPGGSGRCPKCARSPKTATVAYKFNPAAKPIAASSANNSLGGMCSTSNMLGVANRNIHGNINRKIRRTLCSEHRIACKNTKGRSKSDPQNACHAVCLQRRFDLKAPRFQQRLWDVLGVLVAPRPLAQASRAQVLIGGELILAHDLLKFGDRRGIGPIGSGLPQFGFPRRLAMKNCLASQEIKLPHPLTIRFSASSTGFNYRCALFCGQILGLQDVLRRTLELFGDSISYSQFNSKVNKNSRIILRVL